MNEISVIIRKDLDDTYADDEDLKEMSDKQIVEELIYADIEHFLKGAKWEIIRISG